MSSVRVVPASWVAVTVKSVSPSSSFTLSGETLSRMSIGVTKSPGLSGGSLTASSKLMVVILDEVPSMGVCPPPDGLEMEKVKSSSASDRISSVVCTSTVLSAWSVCVKVSASDAAV